MQNAVGRFLEVRQVLYRYYVEMFAEMLAKYRMTQMEINVLLFLADNPRFDTAAELVSIRCLAKSQVSTAVDNMVNRGYLERRVDGRRIHLHLTEAALPVVEEGRCCQQRFSDTVLAGVSQEEQDMLWDVLDRVAENARKNSARMGGDGAPCCTGDMQ